METRQVESIVKGLTDEQLDAIWRNGSEDPDVRGIAALEVGARNGRDRDARHASFHGGAVKMMRVGRRRGYLGEWVCRDCYYGKPWDGR